MFSDSVIQPLIDRLGWSELDNHKFVGKLNDESKTRKSGITLNSFHGLVSLEAVHDCMSMECPTRDEFNAFLKELLQNTILEILNDIYITDDRSKNIDYSAAISLATDSGMFDNCIGYCHAAKVLQLLASSIRSNRNERLSKDVYAEYVIELKGLTDARGTLVSKGLMHKCAENRKLLKEKAHCVPDSVVEDATNHW